MQGQGNKLSLHADYFSELVIYLSLVALAENPNLFSYISVGDSLLFKKEDFSNIANANIYRELDKLSSRVTTLVKILKFYLANNNYLQLPTLSYVWAQVAPSGLSLADDSWFDELIAWADKFKIDEDIFPRDKAQLLALTELDISEQNITYLPDSIGKLTNLQTLNCWNNKLTVLPDSIGKLTNLQTLYCGCNQLSSLPDSIANLTKLQNLYCGGNQLTSLPDSIGKLTNLQEILCDQVVINNLPEHLRKIARTSW